MCQPQPAPAIILRRRGRMEIDRKLERLDARKNRPEEAVVEVAPAMMAVDDDALEAMITRHALELQDRGWGIAHRKRREPQKAGRIAADGFRSEERRVG